MFTGGDSSRARVALLAFIALVGLGVLAWRWTVREGTWRFSARYTLGTLVGLLAFVLAAFAFSA